MSRIGRQPIPVGSAVSVKIDATTVSVKGPKGELAHALPKGITAKLADGILTVMRTDDSKAQRALHGLTRALLANAVRGVSQGYKKDLEIHGVGYRADLAGKVVKLSLGFTHPIEFTVPQGIQIAVEKNTRITISGFDRQQVGQVAANLRGFRPPDVYKLKGVRYADEHLRKKAGKTAAK